MPRRRKLEQDGAVRNSNIKPRYVPTSLSSVLLDKMEGQSETDNLLSFVHPLVRFRSMCMKTVTVVAKTHIFSELWKQCAEGDGPVVNKQLSLPFDIDQSYFANVWTIISGGTLYTHAYVTLSHCRKRARAHAHTRCWPFCVCVGACMFFAMVC